MEAIRKGKEKTVPYKSDYVEKRCKEKHINVQFICTEIMNWPRNTLAVSKNKGSIAESRAKSLAKYFKCDLEKITGEKTLEQPHLELVETKKTEESTMTEKLLAEIAHEVHVNNELMRQLLKLLEQ